MLARYQASKVNGKAMPGKSQLSPVQHPTKLPPSRGHPELPLETEAQWQAAVARWHWAEEAGLLQAMHSSLDGLNPLFSFKFLEKEKGKWVGHGIELERVGQVMLTVGLVLCNLSTAQFIEDYDPSGTLISLL